MEKKLALELVDFLYDSPSACHGVKATQKILNENGFIEIKETDKWDLQPKGKYYVIKNDSALIAFEIGTGDIEAPISLNPVSSMFSSPTTKAIIEESFFIT